MSHLFATRHPPPYVADETSQSLVTVLCHLQPSESGSRLALMVRST
jgi:hypothetical protein